MVRNSEKIQQKLNCVAKCYINLTKNEAIAQKAKYDKIANNTDKS